MEDGLFQLIKVLITVLGIVLTYYVIPYLQSKTTESQRENALYWTKIAIQVSEQIYKDKGQGTLKKEYVLEWLNKNGIKITNAQADMLIDLIVSQFNKNGWDSKEVTNSYK